MPQMTRAHQMMKTFQREVTQKRLLYGSGAARKHTQAQTTVATTMMIVNSRERKNRVAVRKERSPGSVIQVAGLAVGDFRKAVTMAARSAWTWVPGGRPPVARVFSP